MATVRKSTCKYANNAFKQTENHTNKLSEHLEVVGQFGATRVTGVHRDEDGAAAVERQLSAFEIELLEVLGDCALNGLHLLRDHGQHLQLDAVEFVEARPRARLRQTLEELAHRFVVEAVRAVEHDTLTKEQKKVNAPKLVNLHVSQLLK